MERAPLRPVFEWYLESLIPDERTFLRFTIAETLASVLRRRGVEADLDAAGLGDLERIARAEGVYD